MCWEAQPHSVCLVFQVQALRVSAAIPASAATFSRVNGVAFNSATLSLISERYRYFISLQNLGQSTPLKKKNLNNNKNNYFLQLLGFLKDFFKMKNFDHSPCRLGSWWGTYVDMCTLLCFPPTTDTYIPP